MNEVGVWVENEQLDEHILPYFRTMFVTSSDIRSMEFLESMGSRVTKEMNGDLSRWYTVEEVVTTLKQMHPSKAPGSPDGMPPLFYKKY